MVYNTGNTFGEGKVMSEMSLDDAYSFLELENGATDDDVKKAYRRLSRVYHPDLNHSPDATQKMQQLGEAYALITKPQELSQRKRDPSGDVQQPKPMDWSFTQNLGNQPPMKRDINPNWGAVTFGNLPRIEDLKPSQQLSDRQQQSNRWKEADEANKKRVEREQEEARENAKKQFPS